jgi:hypothetical protein
MPTQDQIIDAIRLELEILRTTVFESEELAQYGWTQEKLDAVNRLRNDVQTVGWRGQDDVPERQ